MSAPSGVLRATGIAGLAALLAAAFFLVPTLWGKPWSIDHYFLRVMAGFALEHPMLLSYARILEPYELDFYSDELEDYSTEARRRLHQQAGEVLEGLTAWNRDELTRDQQLSVDVLTWLLETWRDGERFVLQGYPVEQFQGFQSSLPDFMVNIHPFDDARDARNYLSRLEAFEVAFDQTIEGLRERAEAGVIPPRFVLDAVREEIETFSGVPIEENVLYSHLDARLLALSEEGVLEAEEADALREEARGAVGDVVFPAYERLDGALAELQADATDEAGVWKLPDGDAFYRWSLRFHTTTDLSPAQVHDIGLAEVARLQARMRETLRVMGYPSEDPAATIRTLNQEARFLYPDTDEGREQILAQYQAIAEDALARLPALFGRLPQAEVVVKRVPVFKEAGAAGAYYNPPSFDGSRPGVFYANLRSVREIPRFGMRTLTYHEAIPGHHLQIALALEMQGAPLFRRFMPFTSFIEGWALYAETLAAEQGFHPTPADELGYLVAQMFRAVRLVVDTGIHAKRWTREQAIAYMLDHTGMPSTDVVAEIERYIVTPGQACAYKIGQLQMLSLRERARDALGRDFDLRSFHDVVLGNGALPLVILVRVVDEWVAKQLGGEALAAPSVDASEVPAG